MGLWVLSILGGNPRQISDEGWSASVSPDGSQIAFLKTASFGETGQEVWSMRADGTDQRQLIPRSQDRAVYASPVWSPDGRWISYTKIHYGPYSNDTSIEVFNLKLGTSSVVLTQPLTDWALKWLADGRLLYAMDEPPPSQNTSNFWVASMDLKTGHIIGSPSRITTGDDFVDQPSVTTDGKRLVFNRLKPQLDVFVAEFFAKGPRLGTPRRLTLDDSDDLPFDWTLDDSAVLFISNRTGTSNIFNIFRQRIDQTSAEPLVSGPEQKTISRLSPDGSQILFLVPTSPNDNGGQRRAEIARGGQVVRLMRAPINGGPAQTVLEAANIVNYQCSRSPADICVFSQAGPKQLVFSVFNPLSGNPREVAKLGSDWGLEPFSRRDFSLPQ